MAFSCQQIFFLQFTLHNEQIRLQNSQFSNSFRMKLHRWGLLLQRRLVVVVAGGVWVGFLGKDSPLASLLQPRVKAGRSLCPRPLECVTFLCFLTASCSKSVIQLLYFKYKAEGYQPQVGRGNLKSRDVK